MLTVDIYNKVASSHGVVATNMIELPAMDD